MKRIVSIFLMFISLHIIAEDLAIREAYLSKLENKKQLYNQIFDFIQQNPDSPDLAKLYFNLAELSIEVNVFEVDKTVQFFQNVLLSDPDFDLLDIVLYNIGYFGQKEVVTRRDAARINNIELVMNWPDSLRLTEESLKTSIDAYTRILNEFPDSDYYTDAAYRLGRIYFDLALDAREAAPFYQKAIEYFSIVADRSGDPLQNYGLFQRAWTFFASAQFTLAIKDFEEILSEIEQKNVYLHRLFFEADAIENIAFSLIEYDGTDFVNYSQAALKAAQILQSDVFSEYGKQILIQSAELKKKYNAPMQAIDIYEVYLNIYSSDKHSPTIIDSVITLYRRYPNRVRKNQNAQDQIVAKLEELVHNYNTESEWYRRNRDEDIAAELAVINYAYAFLEPRYFNSFLRNQSAEDYQNYETLVLNFIAFDVFEDQESRERKQRMRRNLVNLSQDLSEITEEPAYYLKTIDEISRFIEGQPSDKDLFHYYEQRFYNYEKLAELMKPQIQLDKDPLIRKNYLDSLLIAAADEYESYLQKLPANRSDSEMIRTLYFRAELYLEKQSYDLSERDFNNLLSYPLSDEMRMIALSRLAEISQQKGDFEKASAYYQQASAYASDDKTLDFRNNMLASLLAQAQQLEDRGDYIAAARQYRRLADEVRSSNEEESIGFLIRAIANYKKAGEYQLAIDLYEIIASRKKNSNEILSAYLAAWTIADSLKNWQQSISLRQKFIKIFPRSEEAFRLRMQIIGFFEGPELNDLQKAGQLLEDLHTDARNSDIIKNPSAFLLHAVRVYQKAGDNEKLLQICLLFDQLYPQHEDANELLTIAARIYRDKGNNSGYEKVAARLYQKDPDIDLLLEIAVSNIRNNKARTDSLFAAGKFAAVQKEIDDYRQLEKNYRDQNLNLPTQHIQETYDYYEKYIAFYRRLSQKIEQLKNEILDRTPQELIKVNNLTRWADHLAERENRIGNLKSKCDNFKNDFVALIQEGNEYRLETAKRTESLYLVAKAYDYCSDVVIQQVQLYLDISNQLNNAEMKANPILQKQYKTALKNNSLELANEFRKNAVQVYQTLLITFYDDKDYTDSWAELSLQRLIELGVRSEAKRQIYQSLPHKIVSDSTWLAAVSNLKFDAEQTSVPLSEFSDLLYWYPTGEGILQYYQHQIYGLENSPAQVIWHPRRDTVNADIVYFKRNFVLPQTVEHALLTVFAQNKIRLWINDKQYLDESEMKIDLKMKQVLAVQLNLNDLQTENQIIIEVTGGKKFKGLILEISYQDEGR
jgi:outer membrane protein assembly factor BamD (BamD/ComL family)